MNDLLQWLDSSRHPWLVTLLLAVAALGVGWVAYKVALRVLRRLFPQTSIAGALVRREAVPASLTLPLLLMQLVWHAAPDQLPHIELPRRLTTLALITVFTWIGLRAINTISDLIIREHPVNTGDNLHARRIQTQTRVLARSAAFLFGLVGVSTALMTFPSVRQLGTSLLASAGVAGLAIGLAAKSVLGNLLAGLQIALTQPIRLDDVLIVQGEWGRVEEITGAYVVLNIWDQRRLVIPLQWFIENPFQNWTRTTAQLIGSVFLWVDYRMPLAPLRAELERACRAAPEWDGRLALLQVTDSNERAMQLRALVTSADSSSNWDLRCRVREALIDFVQREYPQYLPQLRATIDAPASPATAMGASPPH